MSSWWQFYWFVNDHLSQVITITFKFLAGLTWPAPACRWGCVSAASGADKTASSSAADCFSSGVGAPQFRSLTEEGRSFTEKAWKRKKSAKNISHSSALKCLWTLFCCGSANRKDQHICFPLKNQTSDGRNIESKITSPETIPKQLK